MANQNLWKLMIVFQLIPVDPGWSHMASPATQPLQMHLSGQKNASEGLQGFKPRFSLLRNLINVFLDF